MLLEIELLGGVGCGVGVGGGGDSALHLSHQLLHQITRVQQVELEPILF